MSMTGGVSFFEKNKALFKDGATATASSNTENAKLALGLDNFFRWQSSGSDDTTTETLTVTLPTAVSISRIFVLSHNLKNFTISTTSGSFTGLVSTFTDGKDEEATLSGGDIVQDNCSTDVAYYEFDAISLDNITISCDETQIADAEKFITQIILSNEIGTLEGYPEVGGLNLSPDYKKEATISGSEHIEKGRAQASFNMNLRSYPVQADVDLLDSLYDRTDPFLVWLCGGLPDQFKIKSRGWRAEDVYQMKISSRLSNAYNSNVYSLGVNQRYKFTEVIS